MPAKPDLGIRRHAGTIVTRAAVAGLLAACAGAVTLYRPSATGAATAPAITQGTPISLSGASLWLHSVVDSAGRVVLSAEQNQSVEMAYFDPTNPTSSPAWKTVITPSMVGTSGLSDHWHIYANGHHWVVVSDTSARNSWLFELDDNFNIVARTQVVANGAPASTTVPDPNTSTVATNDMFLVSETNGVTVAYFLPPSSNRLFRYDFGLNLQSIKDIGGEQSQQAVQSNGASAFATTSGFTVISPTTLAPTSQSSLTEYAYDTNWNLISTTVLLNAANTNFAMGTAVTLPGGDLAVTARVITPLSSSAGVDNGEVVRYVFDSTGAMVTSTTLVGTLTGNRPHTLLFSGTYLLTGWDGSGSGSVSFEIDTLNGATTPTTTTTTPAPSAAGYFMLASNGTVYNFGSAGSYGSAPSSSTSAAMVATPDGKGYWVISSTGAISAFGDAPQLALSASPSGTVAAVAATKDGKGLWVASSAGQVLAAGDAISYGDALSLHPNDGIVSMAVTPDGGGYWLLGGDGGVFSYGDARFHGSTGNVNLDKPAVAMAATSTGNGYWFVASDGGVFAFGDANFYGSLPGLDVTPAKPVDGMVVTSSGKGYWMVAFDGGVFAFGDASFVGSLGAEPPASPIVGFAPV